MTADVKRAVEATLDLRHAEWRGDPDEIVRGVEWERLTLDCLADDEFYDYALALSGALQRQQEALTTDV